MTDDILQDLIKYLQKDFYLHTLKWSQIWRWLSPWCWKYSKIVPLGLGYIKWILSFREIPHPFPSPLFPPSTHIMWPYLTSIIPRVPVLPRVNPPVLIIAFRKWVTLLVTRYIGQHSAPLPPPTTGAASTLLNWSSSSCLHGTGNSVTATHEPKGGAQVIGSGVTQL